MSAPGKNLSKDPWSTCSSCRFWTGAGKTHGLCLRNAPQPSVRHPSQDERPWAIWPITHATDICGEFAAETDK